MGCSPSSTRMNSGEHRAVRVFGSVEDNVVERHKDISAVQKFVSGPMKTDDGSYKQTDEIAGVDKFTYLILVDRGYDRAYKVLGQYLLLGMDKEMFMDFLETETTTDDGKCHMPLTLRERCYVCMALWCKINL